MESNKTEFVETVEFETGRIRQGDRYNKKDCEIISVARKGDMTVVTFNVRKKKPEPIEPS